MIEGSPVVSLLIPGAKDPATADVPGPYLTDYDRAHLAMRIEEQGGRVVYTRGTKAFDHEAGTVNVLHPTITDRDAEVPHVQIRAEVMEIADLDAIRNYVARMGRGLPELNHPRLRQIAYDKGEANTVLGSVGLAKEYAVIGADQPVAAALDAVRADAVVLKPSKGQNSKGLQVGSKAVIASQFQTGELQASEGWVVEELLSFDAPLPVKGMSEEDQARIDQANGNGRAKELRTYTFGRNVAGSPITGFVMRAALDGDVFAGRTKWIFVDEDSIPEEIISGSNLVLEAFENEAHVSEAHLAIDWARTTMASGEDIYVPMEVNASRPQLVYRKENPTVSADLHAKMARQLIRVAQRGGTE